MREPIKPWPGPVYQQVPIALGRQNAIEYIAAINNDLRGLARLHGLDTLAYLLDMAQLEADLLKNGGREP